LKRWRLPQDEQQNSRGSDAPENRADVAAGGADDRDQHAVVFSRPPRANHFRLFGMEVALVQQTYVD
jgi:hypothetical protein